MHLSEAEVPAAIALVGVIFSTLLSSMIAIFSARRSTYISSVTSERIKWINEIKACIEEYIEATSVLIFMTLSDPSFLTSKEGAERRSRLGALANKIALHLNIEGIIERNVHDLVDTCDRYRERSIKPTRLRRDLLMMTNLIDLLTQHSRWLMKTEWERIKIEASGIFYACFLRYKMRRRLYRYGTFCEGDGYFEVERLEDLVNLRVRLKQNRPRPFMRPR